MVEFDAAGLRQLDAIGTAAFDFERAMSGRSLIGGVKSAQSTEERRDWPYSLADYLRGLLGSTVRVEYSAPNGQRMSAAGRLKTVGTDFIALSIQNGEQLLVGLSSIANIKAPLAK